MLAVYVTLYKMPDILILTSVLDLGSEYLLSDATYSVEQHHEGPFYEGSLLSFTYKGLSLQPQPPAIRPLCLSHAAYLVLHICSPVGPEAHHQNPLVGPHPRPHLHPQLAAACLCQPCSYR
jgi:hypothetical protein